MPFKIGVNWLITRAHEGSDILEFKEFESGLIAGLLNHANRLLDEHQDDEKGRSFWKEKYSGIHKILCSRFQPTIIHDTDLAKHYKKKEIIR